VPGTPCDLSELCGSSRPPSRPAAGSAGGWQPLASLLPFDLEQAEDPDDGSGAVGTASASLDTHESTSHPPRQLYQGFRHSGWKRQRQAVLTALTTLDAESRGIFEDTSQPPSAQDPHTPQHPLTPNTHTPTHTATAPPITTPQRGKRRKSYPWSDPARERFELCGSTAWILRTTDKPRRYRVATNRCRHRFCLPCSRERGLLISANLREKLPKVPLKFITLTVKARDLPLAAGMDHLYHSFGKLRRSPTWATYVRGGLAVCEVTWRAEKGRWHPHLHLIVEGPYFPQDLLRIAWLRATGDSFICDIRPVRSLDDAARYLTAYLTKSLCKKVWSDPVHLREAVLALHGRKLISAFGTWAKLRLLEPIDDGSAWETVCSADRLLTSVLEGDEPSCRLAAVLWRRALVDWLKEKPP